MRHDSEAVLGSLAGCGTAELYAHGALRFRGCVCSFPNPLGMNFEVCASYIVEVIAQRATRFHFELGGESLGSQIPVVLRILLERRAPMPTSSRMFQALVE